MSDNSTDLSQAVPASSHTPSPVATPPIVAPAVVEPEVTPPNDAAGQIASPNVTPPVGEVPRRDTVIDPRVAALRLMFPDYEDLILMSVLESVGGNQNRAIDALLDMSDPEYKPEPPAAIYLQQEQPVLSQTDLDEQFARHLMLEEQQQQQQQWINANQRPPVMYQSHPRQQRWNSQTQPAEGEVAADRPAGDFQEQFSRIAESGKKTFGSLFSKVKAKIQEFDQGRSPGQTSGSSTQPTWGANTSAQSQAQSAAVIQPSYFDPNSHSSLESSAPSSPPVAHQSPPTGIRGYDLSPSTSITPPEMPEPLPPSPPMNSPVPRLSSSGTPIDAGKLGLLPKRPVSLLPDPAATGGSSGSPPGASHRPQPTWSLSEDDDGLEYTENPFEEPEK